MPAVPTTRCDAIDRGPSVIAAQPAPRPPSVRLKSSVPICVADGTQVTTTLTTFADAALPDPPATVHASPVGLLATVTSYAPPSTTGVANANDPLLATLRLSPPLSCKTTTAPSDSPETVPPTENVLGYDVHHIVEQNPDNILKSPV